MDADLANVIGTLAGTLTTAAFVPQVYKTWVSRSVRDLSSLWLIAFISGVMAWLVYGLLLGAWPIIIFNAITLALTLALAAMKLAFQRHGGA